MNEQFKLVFKREDVSNIPDTGESDIPAMQNTNIDWRGVHRLLKKLKVHKATGPDEIPAYILKTAADELAPALALLFQLFMNQGEIVSTGGSNFQERRNTPVVKLQTSFSHLDHMQAA